MCIRDQGIDKAKFRAMAKPGDTLRLEVTFTKRRGPMAVAAVSYTHLDVYKRQTPHSSGRASPQRKSTGWCRIRRICVFWMLLH